MARKSNTAPVASEDFDAYVDVTPTHAPAGWTEVETSTEITEDDIAYLAEEIYRDAPAPTEEELGELQAAEDRSNAYQAQSSTVDPSGQDQAPDEDEFEDTPEDADFEEIISYVTEDERREYGHMIAQSFDNRLTFEATKNSDNDTIGGKLAAVRNKLVMPRAAAILIAAEVDPGFINRSISSGSRYNVYAAQKVADLVGALDGRGVQIAINNAVTRSMFRCRAAGIPFTGEIAKAAACDKVRVGPELKGVLIRHTVATGTMATQASSTMNALETLGIVRNVGNHKHPVYELTNSPQTERLELALAA